MMKRVLTAILVLLIVICIGFYVFDLAYHKTPWQENLSKVVFAVAALIISVIRLHVRDGQKRRAGLSLYEKTYEKEIGSAFYNKSANKKKLLEAIRLYDENQNEKALKMLGNLMGACQSPYDSRAVLLFTALCYADLQLHDHAIKTYLRLLENEPQNPRTYSNIGLEYLRTGKYDMAIEYYEKAIALDPGYAYSYNNMANCFFRMYELNKAIPYAKKALELKPDMYQASGLLATIYALYGEQEEQEKYFHLAVSAGKNAEELREGIAYYMAEKEMFFSPEEKLQDED